MPRQFAFKLSVLVALMLLAACLGCAKAPYTNRSQMILMSSQEELALGLQPQGLSRREALARARAFLAERGLADWAERAVGTLSQGQRQQLC